VEEYGFIHLRGCHVAAGEAGRHYMMQLAIQGRRAVTAFDDNVFYTSERNGPDYYSVGSLWLAHHSYSQPIPIGGGQEIFYDYP
jgi:hypothetical protein